MAAIRKPFQGVYNIVRFNWHFYVLAFLIILTLGLTAKFIIAPFSIIFTILALSIFLITFVSLFVSWFVYDYSGLYQMNWLHPYVSLKQKNIANINAGLDEFSTILQQKFRDAVLQAFDFYDALPQKEISITRAQKVYPPHASMKNINLIAVPVKNKEFDVSFLLLAAHEIRDEDVRIEFFKELHRILKDEGTLIVLEHLRDTYNFLAYTIGFFHFLPMNKWLKTFSESGFRITQQNKITPFLTLFILKKDGNSF